MLPPYPPCKTRETAWFQYEEGGRRDFSTTLPLARGVTLNLSFRLLIYKRRPVNPMSQADRGDEWDNAGAQTPRW